MLSRWATPTPTQEASFSTLTFHFLVERVTAWGKGYFRDGARGASFSGCRGRSCWLCLVRRWSCRRLLVLLRSGVEMPRWRVSGWWKGRGLHCRRNGRWLVIFLRLLLWWLYCSASPSKRWNRGYPGSLLHLFRRYTCYRSFGSRHWRQQLIAHPSSSGFLSIPILSAQTRLPLQPCVSNSCGKIRRLVLDLPFSFLDWWLMIAGWVALDRWGRSPWQRLASLRWCSSVLRGASWARGWASVRHVVPACRGNRGGLSTGSRDRCRRGLVAPRGGVSSWGNSSSSVKYGGILMIL